MFCESQMSDKMSGRSSIVLNQSKKSCTLRYEYGTLRNRGEIETTRGEKQRLLSRWTRNKNNSNYLQIETDVPDKSLGFIRAALSKALKTQYGLPIADKYRVRIEPTDNSEQSEVYLTLSSIGEVVNGATRVWQPREKDVELETEMLLKFMLFLGDDMSDSVQKIKSSNEEQIVIISITELSNGYASAFFPFDKKKSWGYLGWALDELAIEIQDRDKLDGSYYITISKNKGFLSKLLSTSSDFVTYKLIVKETDDSLSQVIISELSGQDEQKTINFSYEFFEKIASKF